MQRKENFLPSLIVFFGLSLALILIGRLGIASIFYNAIGNPSSQLRFQAIGFLSLKGIQNKEIKSLKEENDSLKKNLLDNKSLVSENKALKDQFETTTPRSQDLLPAKVIGQPGFLPGISIPDYLIIDKGSRSGIKKGDAVVVGDNLIGRIDTISDGFSKVELISSKKTSFTSKILGNEDTTGIIKGRGNGEFFLDNVLLTKSLKKGDTILTKEERNEEGSGYPPDLKVGKIVSVEKKASDLFQRASVRSEADFINLDYVFIYR